MKIKEKIRKEKIKSFIYKKYNSSFSCKDITNLKNYKTENVSNSLKLKNTQSFSTGIDDVKDNETKEILSLDNLKSFKILQNFSYIYKNNNENKPILNLSQRKLKTSTSNIGLYKFEKKLISDIKNNKNIPSRNIMNNNINLKKDVNKTINITSKNVNNISSENNKKISPELNNINNNRNDINNNKNHIKFNNNNLKLEKEFLKSFPPKMSNLYENNYMLYEKNLKNYNNNFSYLKLNRSKIPNAFYNHLMVHNNKTKNYNSSYYSISTTNRIRGKLLTILYFRPVKKE